MANRCPLSVAAGQNPLRVAPPVPGFVTETAASASIPRDRRGHPASSSFLCLFYFICLLCFPARFSVLSSIAHPLWGAAMPAARRVFLLILALLILLLLFAVPTVSLAQEPSPPSPPVDAARQLAAKIAATFQPGDALVLTHRNRSSLTASELASFRSALENELIGERFAICDEPCPRGHPVRVTLSDRASDLLWVAEVSSGEIPTTLMVLVPRSAPDVPPRLLTPLLLKKELLWEQVGQILDLAIDMDPGSKASRLVVLEPTQLVFCRKDSEQWKLADVYRLPLARPLPRDPAGRVRIQDGMIEVSLPGLDCDGSAAQTIKVQCEQDTSLGWISHNFPPPLRSRLVPGRNHYEAILLAGSEINWKVPPFYSAASIEDEDRGDTIWLFGSTDNRVRLYTEKNTDPVTVFSGWGSDLTTVSTDCGTESRKLLLVSQPGDWTEADAVRAFELQNQQAVPVSMPLEFPGPVTALRTDADRDTAFAVARNLKTGRYEAYRLTISCGK